MVSGEVCVWGVLCGGACFYIVHIFQPFCWGLLPAPEEVYLGIASLGPELGAFLESTVMSR